MKNHALIYLNNGVVVIGAVENQTKTKLTLNNPCIIMFVDDEDDNPAMQLSILIEPSLTDERVFTIDSKQFLFEPMKPRDSIIEFYDKFVSKQKELDGQ